MQPENAAEARDLMYLASIDLQAAERLLRGEPSLVEPTLFHSQQTAEKALKAYLAWRGQAFRRTHDLVALLTDCQRIAPDFAEILPPIVALAPYAVAPRNDRVLPSRSVSDGDHAFHNALIVYNFALSHLPATAHP